MRSETLVADTAYERADVFLAEKLEITRSNAKRLLDNGDVLRGGKAVKASAGIAEGDKLDVSIPDPVSMDARPEDIPLDIVYQDESFAVINKPQGMTVHAGSGNYEGTLVNALLYNLDSLSGINGVIRPGIVHRIDKNTSGLLVVAKNDAAHVSLAKQIEDKICHRTYLALLEGIVKEDKGTITTYIGRSAQDRTKMAVTDEGHGRIAVTDFEVLERYPAGYTLCRFDLHTGRTHQIRVHAKYMGHPVVGDDVYGYKKQKFHLQGQLLHAWKLTLRHPVTGEEMTFEAPLPDYFQDVLNKLKH
ncbi:MAG: RluA family pseudouridine synthase [Clostridia bacterium]|nr:RluA family pseudouridine synthase [Clostridia bacterium]